MKVTTIIYRIFRQGWKYIPFKRSICITMRFCGFRPGKYEREFWFTGKFSVHLNGKSFWLYASEGDYSTLSVFWTPLDKGWDAISIQVWYSLSRNSNLILDIGSNIGLYALVAKISNPDAQVIAFEPGKKSGEILKKNIELNDLDIRVSDVAISNRDGEATFYDLDKPTAAASLKPSDMLDSDSHGLTYRVKMRKLSGYLKEMKVEAPDLISIDVERNEPEVLDGMDEILKNQRPNLIIEVLDNEMGKEIGKRLNGMNYLYFNIDEKKRLRETKELKKQEGSIGYNFLVCREDALKSIRQFI